MRYDCPRCKGLVVATYDEHGSIMGTQVCFYMSCVNCGWVQYDKLKEKYNYVPQPAQNT